MDDVLKYQPAGRVIDKLTVAMAGNLSDDAVAKDVTFPPAPAVISEPICEKILYEDIADTRIRIWDLIILVPNSLFMMFLFWNMRSAIRKLKLTNSPIFAAFYILVWLATAISVLRCIVGMTVNASYLAGDITDKALWLILRFFLLATELSVVAFGLAFGHLDSKTSIRRVLWVTVISAFVYSCVQGTLEFVNPDPKFHVQKGTAKNFDIFAHGGMIFWLASSAFFTIVYTVIFFLPWTHLKEKLNLPGKKSFYYYALFLAFLNCAQAVGSGLLYSGVLNGMCVVDTTTYTYFTCFHPLVYATFLRDFFRMSPESIPPFSYKFQSDEGTEDDIVSLPYQTDSKYNPENLSDAGSFDSTHFDKHSNPNVISINAGLYGLDGSYQNA